jgi:isopentenyl-diphosphate delta-isomerase
MGEPSSEPVVVALADDRSPTVPVNRSDAHRAPGVLHLAVSLQVVDRASREWLLQRRAASKALFPSRWANSCCTHPAPGEDPAAAARRRLREETGLMVDEDVLPAGAFTYRAVDAGSGFVEHEYDYVFVAYADVSRAVPDPTEIDELAALPFD